MARIFREETGYHFA